MKVEFVFKRLISMEYMKLNGKKKPNQNQHKLFFHLKAEKPKISPLLICLP